MKLNTALGSVIRDIRMEKGMTLRDLSNKSFISLGHLSDTERGTKNISPDLIEAVAFGLDTPSYHLIQVAGMRMEFQNAPIQMNADKLVVTNS
jgi:transcriptional regulator with XRE-family HTH domain